MKKNFFVANLLVGSLLLSGCSFLDLFKKKQKSNEPQEEQKEDDKTPSGGDDSSGDDTNPPSSNPQLDAFNNFKNSIKTNHNYSVTIHSYLDGYQDDPDNVYDDELLMINDNIYCWNSSFGTGKSGYIKQSNQGYVYFDYYGNNVLTNGFYSTRSNVGISTLTDLVVENLFLGEYVQDETNKDKFTTSNVDAIAVVANLSGFEASVLVAPENIYFLVNSHENSLTLHSEFVMHWFDEGEKSAPVISTLKIHDVGSTSHAALEAYVQNPTDTYVAPTSWSSDDVSLFNELYAGTAPTFVTGLSYSSRVSRFNDLGIYKVLVSDYASGDLTSSYVSVLDNELFQEIDSERSSRLFKRVDVDNINMTQTTYTVEIAFASPNSEDISRLYPNGVFQILFKGKIANTNINTVQLFNQYLTTKGYSNFVPLLNMNSSIAISNFSDKTDDMNNQAGSHAYEFYTATSPMRIHISDYATAKAAAESYISTFASYGFTNVSHNGLTKQVNYTNTERFKTDSAIIMSDFDVITESDYPGYIEIRYQIYAEKDETDLPHLVGIDLEDYQTDFAQGDTFVYGGKVRAQYSNGDSHLVDVSECVFDQYNMNQSGDQTVRVSYTEGNITVYGYYNIHVTSTRNYTCSFLMYGDNINCLINLCDDGTGTYTYTRSGSINGSWTQYFTFVISESTITFTLADNYSTSDFTRFSLFAGEAIGTTRLGSYDSLLDKITVDISTASGANAKTLELSRA